MTKPKWTLKDRWLYDWLPRLRYTWCRIVGHKNLREIAHWEICEYNYGMPGRPDSHLKGGEVGDEIERFCLWCDFTDLDEKGRYRK